MSERTEEMLGLGIWKKLGKGGVVHLIGKTELQELRLSEIVCVTFEHAWIF